jgi:hypothetical protein
MATKDATARFRKSTDGRSTLEGVTMAQNRKWYGAAGLLAAGALSGGILAGSLSANAATTTTPSSSPSAAQDGAHGCGHAGEMTVTGADATTLKAAALKAVPGGTVDRAETDSGDAAYEVHMTKSDGTQVTVKFSKSLKMTAVEDGMGK